MDLFREAIVDCALSPMTYTGERFTWKFSSGADTIQERLDWALINSEWEESIPLAGLTHLDFFGSDHRPLLLTIGDLPEVGNSSFSHKRKRFRYEAMWSIDPECHQIVSSSWESTPASSVTEVVLHNISSCAQILGEWHEKKYGKLPKDIRNTKRRLAEAENKDSYAYDHLEVNELESQLSDLLEKEEIFWQQRSRIQWLKAGDQNTKFFHQYANTRRRNNAIPGLFFLVIF
ncbi:hypothetical protein CsatB_009621 [Cannabis sativa]